MSLLFWRKTRDTGQSRPDGISQTVDKVVSEDDPLPVQLIHLNDDDYPPVEIKGEEMPPVAGRSKRLRLKIPGISTGIYADGDAFGTTFTLADVFRAERPSGWITGARLIDLDDEGVQVDVHFFSAPLAGTADNAALAHTDVEMVTWLGAISVDTFFNLSANQGGQSSAAPLHIVADGSSVYTQLCIRGTPTIAAGAEPWLVLFVTPD